MLVAADGAGGRARWPRRTGRPGARMRGDGGSVMMLMPAAVLVMIVLASIGADLSHVHMARAALSDLAQTIANDVATEALDTGALRNTGQYRIDLNRARTIAQNRIDFQGTQSLDGVEIRSIAQGDAGGTTSVTVTLAARVEHIFGKGIPNAGDAMPLIATSTAALRDGP